MRKRRIYNFDSKEESSIDLTPLIDVVFVVLIMFILVAPILELDHIELAQASEKRRKENSSIQQTSPLTLSVRADNTIWFNKNLVTLNELNSLLKKEKMKNPHAVPQLFQDKKALFGTYQMVKNSIETAGFEQIDVILQPH